MEDEEMRSISPVYIHIYDATHDIHLNLAGEDEDNFLHMPDIVSTVGQLKSIKLHLVEIEATRLLYLLVRTPLIEHLELNDVRFLASNDDRTVSFIKCSSELRESVFLPRLKSYKLLVARGTELGNVHDKEVFAGWFPFVIRRPAETIVQYEKDLAVLSHEAGTIFLIDHAKHELQCRLQWTNAILYRLPAHFKCTKLVVYFCDAFLDVRLIPRHLTHLELSGTFLMNGEIADILNSSRELRVLYLDGVHNMRPRNVPGYLLLGYLCLLPELESLWLDHMRIEYTSNSRFPSITELIVDSRMSGMDDMVFNNFINIFPNVHSLVILTDHPLVIPLVKNVFSNLPVSKLFLRTNYLEKPFLLALPDTEVVKNLLLQIHHEQSPYFSLQLISTPTALIWHGESVYFHSDYLNTSFLNTKFSAYYD